MGTLMRKLCRALRAHAATVLQVVGGLALAFGIGVLAGWAWAVTTGGGALLALGVALDVPDGNDSA